MDSRVVQLSIAHRPASREAEDNGPPRRLSEEFHPVRPIGQLLIEAGLISESDLARGLAFQERYGGRLGSILVRLGALSEERLLPILSAQLGLPVIAEDDLPGNAAAFL